MTALPLVSIERELIRVLVVEDDESISDMLKILLRSKSVQSHFEVNGLRNIVIDFDPHVIILDYILRDGDALDALAGIHSLVKRSIPIIFTGHKIPEPIQTQLYMLGVMNIITKPSNISTIESVIENYYEISLKYRS